MIARTRRRPRAIAPAAATRARRRARLAAGTALGAAVLALPGGASAATMTFGSPLSVPATLGTADNLAYAGSNAVQYGTGVTIHNNHDGADTALWNTSLADGQATSPAGGQVLSVSVEGCAQPATNGPAPLTQFHVQSLTPAAGGGATVSVTSQAFDLPVCGTATPSGGLASGSTVSTYAPDNMCVSAGGYVDFNDEGGFDAQYYPSGVQYEVIGAVGGTTMSSYIDANGTNNGDALSAMNVTATSGFATNHNEEVMLRVTLGTGSDASPACAASSTGQSGGGSTSGGPRGSGGGGGGGGAGKPTAHPGPGQPGGSPGVVVTPRTESLRGGHVRVALFCAQRTTPCVGTVTLSYAGVTLASAQFSGRAHTVVRVPLVLAPPAVSLVRRDGPNGLRTTMTVTLIGQSPVTGTVTLHPR